jgi:hypothetical protein
LLLYRSLLVFAIRVMLRSPRAARDKVISLKWLALTLHDYRVVRATSGDSPYVADEGMAQRAFDLFAEGTRRTDTAAVRRFAAKVPLPDVVVEVRTSGAMALDRLERRNWAFPDRLRTLDAAAAAQRLADAYIDVYAVALDEFARAGVVVRAFDGDRDPVLLAAEIAKFIDLELDARIAVAH